MQRKNIQMSTAERKHNRMAMVEHENFFLIALVPYYSFYIAQFCVKLSACLREMGAQFCYQNATLDKRNYRPGANQKSAQLPS